MSCHSPGLFLDSPHDVDGVLHKRKQFRRVATGHDKLIADFMGFVKLAGIAIWLK